MANLKISDLTVITPDGTEYIEGIIAPYSPGTNRRMTAQSIADLGGDDHFKGVFASAGALTTAFPTADEGDYAFVDTGAVDASLYIWDDTDTVWIESGVTTVVPDADETTKGIIEIATQAEVATGTDDLRAITPLKLNTTFSDFVVLTDAAPVVADCATKREPKFYLETATSRTLDLQNVRGDSVLNAYSVLTFIIKKTTGSDVILTLDTGFTNKDIITDGPATTFTLAGALNSYHKISALVFGQASAAIIWWNHITINSGLTLTTGSIYVGVSNVPVEKALGAEFDVSSASMILTALGIAGTKIAAGAITFAKMLGAVGSGERFYVHDNAGAVTAPYGAAPGTITDGTVISNLTTESGWSAETKAVSSTFEGQTYQGTGSTGFKYQYYIKVDGTAIRWPVGESVSVTSIQLPPCTEVTGTTQQMAINNAYVANNGGLVTLTLPTVAAVGDIVELSGKGAGGWRIAQNASQTIHGATNSTTGVTGHIDSGAQYNCVKLKCITASTDWVIQTSVGTIGIT